MIYFYIRYIILRKGGQSRRKGRVSVKNRVTATIGGMEYHLLADDDPQYVKKTAELVDRKLREVHQGSANLSALTAAVMAALNIADDYYKAQAASDSLRSQIREYADEAASLRAELARLKRG